jgi:Cu-Zn family superoxide dismutase
MPNAGEQHRHVEKEPPVKIVAVPAALLSLAVLTTQAQTQTQPGARTPPSAPNATASATAAATLKPTTAPGSRGIAGRITLAQRGNSVVIEGTVTGLAPNTEHGFHIHENGDCSGDGKAAGDHFNPDRHEHAGPGQPMRHAGDLYNLKSDAQGKATLQQDVDAITLDPGKNSVLGKALVVHAKSDDYKTQPAGDSGDRVACGVIGR